MYPDRKENIAFGRGCEFDCIYCKFRHTMSRSNCELCRTYTPHTHPESLRPPKRTKQGEFSTIALNGDISFLSGEAWQEIIEYMQKYNETPFMLQSKDPSCFLPYQEEFPAKTILCTTIETDRDTSQYSKAPLPVKRFLDMRKLKGITKHATIEPIMDLDPFNLKRWLLEMGVEVVNIGYDSRKISNPDKFLPEPTLEKTQAFIQSLREAGVEVREKLMREGRQYNGNQ